MKKEFWDLMKTFTGLNEDEAKSPFSDEELAAMEKNLKKHGSTGIMKKGKPLNKGQQAYYKETGMKKPENVGTFGDDEWYSDDNLPPRNKEYEDAINIPTYMRQGAKGVDAQGNPRIINPDKTPDDFPNPDDEGYVGDRFEFYRYLADKDPEEMEKIKRYNLMKKGVPLKDLDPGHPDYEDNK